MSWFFHLVVFGSNQCSVEESAGGKNEKEVIWLVFMRKAAASTC
jgi:hypothetical protein